MQVGDDERVIVATPDFFRNLTVLLAGTEKRDLANYLMWRATRSSLGHLSKEAREVEEEYAR